MYLGGQGKGLRRITSACFRITLVLACMLFLHSVRMLTTASHKEGPKRRVMRYAYPVRFSASAMAEKSWMTLSAALDKARPTLTAFAPFSPLASQNAEDVYGEPLNYTNVIPMQDAELAALKESQTAFRAIVEAGQVDVPFTSQAKGIVIAAEASNLPSVYMQLLLLQRLGSTLHVQVFLRTYADYDRHLCIDIFPLFRAECRILEQDMESAPMPRMPETNVRRHINVFEPLFKMLAVYFSDFEEVLLLDSHIIPVNRPDELFLTEPYLSAGLVLWPDFWASSESSKVFAFQDREKSSHYQPEDVRTTDMGQFLISKKLQSNTLLVGIYYATYGERLYDVLFKQSVDGDRGADSLKFAAKLLQAPYYIPRRFVEAIGFPDEDQEPELPFKGVAMVQSYPVDDYHGINKWGQRPLFIRQNLHPDELDPKTFFFSRSQKHHRMWEWFGAKDRIYDLNTADVERTIWQLLHTIACTDSKHFQLWSPIRAKKACFAIVRHQEQMAWFRTDDDTA